MFRKIILLLCIAYVVICYGYPCLILPFGSYERTYESAGFSVTESYSFGLDGKVTRKIGELEEKSYYKVKGNKIYFSNDNEFDFEDDIYSIISSISRIGGYTNKIGNYMSIGVGALALVLVISIPKNKKRR